MDLRFDSTTFGKWEGFILSEFNHDVLYIPKGFAHGFLALEDDSIFSYRCTNKYAPEFDSGIKFDDPDINIEWPFNLIDTEILTSEKIQSFKVLRNLLQRTNQ